MRAVTSTRRLGGLVWRSKTASYSITNGTDSAIENASSRSSSSNANDAPVLDRQAATRTEVSKTTSTSQWYHGRYRSASALGGNGLCWRGQASSERRRE